MLSARSLSAGTASDTVYTQPMRPRDQPPPIGTGARRRPIVVRQGLGREHVARRSGADDEQRGARVREVADRRAEAAGEGGRDPLAGRERGGDDVDLAGSTEDRIADHRADHQDGGEEQWQEREWPQDDALRQRGFVELDDQVRDDDGWSPEDRRLEWQVLLDGDDRTGEVAGDRGRGRTGDLLART